MLLQLFFVAHKNGHLEEKGELKIGIVEELGEVQRNQRHDVVPKGARKVMLQDLALFGDKHSVGVVLSVGVDEQMHGEDGERAPVQQPDELVSLPFEQRILHLEAEIHRDVDDVHHQTEHMQAVPQSLPFAARVERRNVPGFSLLA